MDSATTLILNALTLISILALVALGLAIIYGLMNVINLAHGEFVTIGAYTLVMVQQLGGSFWLALIVAPITGFLIGSFIEVALIRRLYARPIATILATWGLSLILQQVIQLYFGPAPQRVVEPFVGAVDVLGASYPAYRLFLIGAAIAVFLLVALVFRFTSFGLDIRAVIQNSRMAESLGVDASSVYRNAFGLGAAHRCRRPDRAAHRGGGADGCQLPGTLVLCRDHRWGWKPWRGSGGKRRRWRIRDALGLLDPRDSRSGPGARVRHCPDALPTQRPRAGIGEQA